MFKTRRVILLFCLAAAAFAFACDEKPQDLTSLFPENIAGLRRTQLISGQEALDKIDKLHGKKIVVEEGAIGVYQAGVGPPVMVWISRAKTADIAAEQTEVMVQKMVASPGSPFHDPSQGESEGVIVYRFLGMGQVHYIFCRDDLAYWISASSAHAGKVLSAFL
ncbi:MAG: hypothetical protein SVS15_10800 [Thermodesulfobacteriota bacterium]|nr:hypothetical protein [Thermodesulfobacteriota bacterium]